MKNEEVEEESKVLQTPSQSLQHFSFGLRK